MDQDKKTDFPDLVRLPPHNHTKHFFVTICSFVMNFFKNKNKKEIEILEMKLKLRETLNLMLSLMERIII